MRKKLSAFILLYAFWLLLTVNVEHGKLLFDPGFVIVGALLTLLVVFLTAGKYPRREWLLNPVRWLWLFIYVPYFLYLCVKANLDVAYRVVHPDMPIRPGIVRVRTSLTSELAKTFLANSITLTPGTLTVDIDGPDLYIHWIHVVGEDPEAHTAVIVQGFERFLRRIFE